jgi:uncharacterized protein
MQICSELGRLYVDYLSLFNEGGGFVQLGVPFIHLFSTPLGYYCFDVNTDLILEVPKQVYMYLSDPDNAPCDSEILAYVDNLRGKGHLSSHRIAESEHALTEILDDALNSKITLLILQVTQSCNLRCSYCIYSGSYNNRGHSSQNMDFEVAQKAIDYYINHSRDTRVLSIGFYGGEPLLRIDFIKDCVAYIEDVAEGRTVKYGVTTNGTLLSEDIASYFSEKEFGLTISLDGPDYIHDKHRRYNGTDEGSFSTMMENIFSLKMNHPEYYKEHVIFNTVLDPSNGFGCVDGFLLDNAIFEEAFFSSSVIDNRYLKNDGHVGRVFTVDFLVEREYELFRLFLKKLGRLQNCKVSKLLETFFSRISRQRIGKQDSSMLRLPEKYHHSGPCMPGVMRLFVSAEGNLYPCERVSEESEISRIGTIYDGIDRQKAELLLNIEKETSAKCRNCWAYLYCGICIGEIDGLDKICTDKLKDSCPLMRDGVEETFKDYCVLKSLGYDFEAEELNDKLIELNKQRS